MIDKKRGTLVSIFLDFFRFIILHFDIIAILLLSFAIISLSLKVTNQQSEIADLKKEIYEIQLYKNTNR